VSPGGQFDLSLDIIALSAPLSAPQAAPERASRAWVPKLHPPTPSRASKLLLRASQRRRMAFPSDGLPYAGSFAGGGEILP
jgi:hypothetical protein